MAVIVALSTYSESKTVSMLRSSSCTRSSFAMLFSEVRIIRFSSYLLQIASDSCKNRICLEGVMSGCFQ